MVDAPPLRVSPNRAHAQTVMIESGRKGPGEPYFDGHYVIRDRNGALVDYYRYKENVERNYPDAVFLNERRDSSPII